MDKTERIRLTQEAIRIRQSGVPNAKNAALAILKPLFDEQIAKLRATRDRIVASTANDR